MKKIKKLSLLLAFALFASLFSGCTIEEKGLADAFIKNQEILSVESTTDLKFDLSSTGLSEEEQVSFDSVANTINNLNIKLKQKSLSDEEQTMAKGQVDAKVKLDDITFESSVWIDLDFSGNEMVFKEIFKLPSLLKASMGEEMGNKEYLVLDFDTMDEAYENMGVPVNYNEMMEIVVKYQEKFVDVFKEYVKNYDPNLSLVTKLDDKVIDGESVDIYQVKFDDDSFKKFLKYNIISILEDKEIAPLFKDYMSELMALNGQIISEDIDLTKDIPKLVEETKEFFETFKKVNILGKDGIVINYGVNKDGFIISEEGKIDLLIDTESIMSLSSDEVKEDLSTMPSQAINFVISYDTKITSINEDIDVVLPETTDENSIDFATLMEDMTPEIEDDSSVLIIVEDEFLDLTKQPLHIDKSIYVASRDIAAGLGAEVDWNESTKEITITKDDTVLAFNLNSDVAVKNGEKVDLESKIVAQGETGFVPLRFVAESLGFDIDWDAEYRIISIYAK